MSKPRRKPEDPAVEATDVQAEPENEETVAGEAIQDEDATPDATPGENAESEDAGEPDPIAALQAERDAFQEKWLRAVAEMENVRKRSRRELVDSRRFAQADLLRPLLEVHDNFERALQSFDQGDDTDGGAGIREGVDLIFQKFRSVLKDRGVEAIAALEQEFDPKFHEAVGQLAREGAEAGTVIEVVQPGYILDGEFVLRPARVIVAQ